MLSARFCWAKPGSLTEGATYTRANTTGCQHSTPIDNLARRTGMLIDADLELELELTLEAFNARRELPNRNMMTEIWRLSQGDRMDGGES
jgi:hypothetical protein